MSEELHPTIAGETVTIRRIRMSDVDMERDFIRRLSPETKHFRFLGGVSELTPTSLKRLCNVDGNHTRRSLRRCAAPIRNWRSE